MHFDLGIYVVHLIFWLCFAAAHFAARGRSGSRTDVPPAVPAVPATSEPMQRAPHAGLLMAIHTVGFALMYAGIGNAVFGRRMPAVSPLMRGAGIVVILAGGAIAAWARLAFASWRFRAQLDAGHQLATGGPFRWMRHPIYAALDLLAIGTALWIPSLLTLLGAVGMIIGSELRARAEEKLLERAFGDAYREYQQRTSRFIPGIY
jgi:protein-S-isoprenylcysteine O-methyltransferase Ste14